jgi:hypothetical protein
MLERKRALKIPYKGSQKLARKKQKNNLFITLIKILDNKTKGQVKKSQHGEK